jgi:hypothetical protein
MKITQLIQLIGLTIKNPIREQVMNTKKAIPRWLIKEYITLFLHKIILLILLIIPSVNTESSEEYI